MQAETLSKILSEMATKEYLDAQFAVVNQRLDRAATKEELLTFKSEVVERIDRQTRWMVSLVLLLAILLGLPATVLGLLSYYG